MSGGHWNYLSPMLEERAGQPLNEVWNLLAAIEHALDWGISCDSCYECAKIRTIYALEAYFNTGATSVEGALRLLRDGEPECAKCKAWHKQHKTPREQQPRPSMTVDLLQNGKRFRGVVYMEGEA